MVNFANSNLVDKNSSPPEQQEDNGGDGDLDGGENSLYQSSSNALLSTLGLHSISDNNLASHLDVSLNLDNALEQFSYSTSSIENNLKQIDLENSIQCNISPSLSNRSPNEDNQLPNCFSSSSASVSQNHSLSSSTSTLQNPNPLNESIQMASFPKSTSVASLSSLPLAEVRKLSSKSTNCDMKSNNKSRSSKHTMSKSVSKKSWLHHSSLSFIKCCFTRTDSIPDLTENKIANKNDDDKPVGQANCNHLSVDNTLNTMEELFVNNGMVHDVNSSHHEHSTRSQSLLPPTGSSTTAATISSSLSSASSTTSSVPSSISQLPAQTLSSLSSSDSNSVRDDNVRDATVRGQDSNVNTHHAADVDNLDLLFRFFRQNRQTYLSTFPPQPPPIIPMSSSGNTNRSGASIRTNNAAYSDDNDVQNYHMVLTNNDNIDANIHPIRLDGVQENIPQSVDDSASGEIIKRKKQSSAVNGQLQSYIHTQIDYINCLVPDLLAITNCTFYWGKMDRYEAERLLEGKAEGTFLLRDSAQEDHLFSVSFRRFDRSLHARIEQWRHRFSFDSHDPCVFSSHTVTGLIEHYKDPSHCMFFEPMLTKPLNRNFVFSLQHLARVNICDRVTYETVNNLPLPLVLKSYLKEYHYRTKVRTKHFDETYRYLDNYYY